MEQHELLLQPDGQRIGGVEGGAQGGGGRRRRLAHRVARAAMVRVARLPGVFRPLSDTWLLAATARAQPQVRGGRVLELCTGSGAVAMSVALAGARSVTAVDVSRRAVWTVRLNARLNGVRVDARRGDLLAAVDGERFDLVCANPPYLPAAARCPAAETRATRKPAGRAAIARSHHRRRPAHLLPGGALLVVHSSVVGEPATLERMRAAGLEPGSRGAGAAGSARCSPRAPRCSRPAACSRRESAMRSCWSSPASLERFVACVRLKASPRAQSCTSTSSPASTTARRTWPRRWRSPAWRWRTARAWWSPRRTCATSSRGARSKRCPPACGAAGRAGRGRRAARGPARRRARPRRPRRPRRSRPRPIAHGPPGRRWVLLEAPLFDDDVDGFLAGTAEVRGRGFATLIGHPERCLPLMAEGALDGELRAGARSRSTAPRSPAATATRSAPRRWRSSAPVGSTCWPRTRTAPPAGRY